MLEMTSMIWFGLAGVFALIEMASLGFFLMFFATGALVAGILSIWNPDLTTQIIVFLSVSVALLVFARPLVKNALNIKETPHKHSNVEALMGKEALVLSEISQHQGRVKVLHTGEIWSACLDHDKHPQLSLLEEGKEGIISGIDGAKLLIVPKEPHAHS
ncbi:MAG: NfeD family protein [Cyanobacteria bacterium]|nr:NfeD family protein [Cyanobacteriota bacterium]